MLHRVPRQSHQRPPAGSGTWALGHTREQRGQAPRVWRGWALSQPGSDVSWALTRRLWMGSRGPGDISGLRRPAHSRCSVTCVLRRGSSCVWQQVSPSEPPASGSGGHGAEERGVTRKPRLTAPVRADPQSSAFRHLSPRLSKRRALPSPGRTFWSHPAPEAGESRPQEPCRRGLALQSPGGWDEPGRTRAL